MVKRKAYLLQTGGRELGKTVQIVWTLHAINDCGSIPTFVADTEIAPEKFMNKIIPEADTLTFHPFVGRPIPENAPTAGELKTSSFSIHQSTTKVNCYLN